MRRIFVAWLTAFGAVVGFAGSMTSANAQATEITLPAGSMEWVYECRAGVSCPTTCSLQGKEVFSTANYVSITVVRLPDHVYWFRVDTGDKPAEFIFDGGQIVCSFNTATLKTARAWESGSSEPRKRQ